MDLGAMAMKGCEAFPSPTSITGTSPSDCLVSYPAYCLERVLTLCREAVSVFYSFSRLGNYDPG